MSELPVPGWYPDPDDASSQRYWDGTRWTDDRAPYSSVATASRTRRAGGGDGLVIAGYIGGVLIPIVGIVIGAILIQRANRHGPWVLGLSLLMIAIPVAVYVGSE